MLKCKSCNSKLEKAGTAKLNAAMYIGHPFGAFTWTGDTRSQVSLLLFVSSFGLATFSQSVLAILGMAVFLGYHILVMNDPKQLYKCSSCPGIYVGNKLLVYRRDDDLYL